MISRRQFLQVAGISVYGLSSVQLAHALELVSPPAFTGQVATYGRVLFPTPVTNDLGIVISNLIPDTVVQLNDSLETTYILNQGVVSRSAVQPMSDFGVDAFVPESPCRVEVIAPVAAIRQWCAPSASLISRVGHGGVLYVVDSLVVQGFRWLGVASQPDSPPIGWTEAVRWREVTMLAEAASLADSIQIDRHTQQMNVFNGDHLLWSVNTAVSETLPAGTYLLDDQLFSSTLPEAGLMGVPYTYTFSGYTLSGAYWHNEFGQESGRTLTGALVQIPPATARWIYHHFRSNGTLHVV